MNRKEIEEHNARVERKAKEKDRIMFAGIILLLVVILAAVNSELNKYTSRNCVNQCNAFFERLGVITITNELMDSCMPLCDPNYVPRGKA